MVRYEHVEKLALLYDKMMGDACFKSCDCCRFKRWCDIDIEYNQDKEVKIHYLQKWIEVDDFIV